METSSSQLLNNHHLIKTVVTPLEGPQQQQQKEMLSSTLLSFSCRSRAESFARKLQLKLKNLNNGEVNNENLQNQNGCPDNNSDYYFDFDIEPNNTYINACDDDDLLCCHDNNKNGEESSSGCGTTCCVSPDENIIIRTCDDSDQSSDSVYYDVSQGSSPPKNNIDPILEITKNKLKVEIPNPNNDFYTSSSASLSPTPRVQRSSSLKTGKTPPGTPGRKKIVRFADVLGLDLADVRTFLDEIPNVPKSAFKDLTEGMEQMDLKINKKANNKTLLPSFHQPVAMPDFFDKIRDQKVLLENAFLVENFTVKGTVRVKNMDFHKSVYIRYTYDDWNTFTDFMTSYVSGSCDGFSDKFEFTINLCPELVEIGGRISFACRFHCQGQQFWDNNCGRNYVFHCVPGSVTSSYNNQQQSQSFFQPTTTTTTMSFNNDPWVTRMWL